jgi:hypothetical protein
MFFLFDRALPSWLLAGTGLWDRFFPAPHAVPSLPAGSPPRTVLARMMVNNQKFNF